MKTMSEQEKYSYEITPESPFYVDFSGIGDANFMDAIDRVIAAKDAARSLFNKNKIGWRDYTSITGQIDEQLQDFAQMLGRDNSLYF